MSSDDAARHQDQGEQQPPLNASLLAALAIASGALAVNGMYYMYRQHTVQNGQWPVAPGASSGKQAGGHGKNAG